ncbi:hypothetical protein N9467_07855 [Litorivicinus sp.]|nr:hypothetical protein [Litorivicinus sp.]
MKWISLLVLSFVLVGCKSDLNKSAKNAKDQLVGSSQDRVAQCMGLPHRTGVVSGYEIWEYSTGDETNVSGRIDYYGNVQMNSRTRNCTAEVTFNKDKKVMSVNYSGKTGGRLWTHAKCGELVERCY